MDEKTTTQLHQALKNEDAFAMTIIGIYYIDNGTNQNDIDRGFKIIYHSGISKNCIFAKNILMGLRANKDFIRPILKCTLVESDALEQLRIYADSGNMWAMTVYGNLLYTGYSNPQNKEEGAKYLNMAADRMCYFALELIEEYGIKREPQPSFGKIYDALKNKDYSKFWLK